MIVYREREPRDGERVCHLFRDCRVLSGKAFDVGRVPEGDPLIPTCNGCRSGSTVPGHPNERVPA